MGRVLVEDGDPTGFSADPALSRLGVAVRQLQRSGKWISATLGSNGQLWAKSRSGVTLSQMIRHMADACAASHPEVDPWGRAWSDTEKWDIANSNWGEMDAREPDHDLLFQAIESCDAGDFAGAMLIFRNLAMQGSVRSMLELGRCCEYARGTSRDLAEAEEWYARAATAGSEYAMLGRARLAALRKDFDECCASLQPGVDNRSASAAFWQAWYRVEQSDARESYRSIFLQLKRAAKQGHPGAQAILANFMVRGKFGVYLAPFGFIRAARMAISNRSRS